MLSQIRRVICCNHFYATVSEA